MPRDALEETTTPGGDTPVVADPDELERLRGSDDARKRTSSPPRRDR